jgi:uncharacterized protein YjbJ (UPF0337 family)
MTDHDRDRTLGDLGAEDSARGKGNDLKGRIKDAAGALTGDNSLQAEGKMDRAKGKVQDKLGKAERELDDLNRKP